MQASLCWCVVRVVTFEMIENDNGLAMYESVTPKCEILFFHLKLHRL